MESAFYNKFMQIDFYNDEEFNKFFLSASLTYLSKIRENNTVISLQRIKFDKLKKVAKDLDSYCPFNEVRKEKKLFIEYLKKFDSRPIEDFSFRELLELERDYLLPTIDGKLRDIGYTRRYGWLLALIFSLPLDILLLILIGEYYFYIPILSIYTLIKGYAAQNKAKKENKLW